MPLIHYQYREIMLEQQMIIIWIIQIREYQRTSIHTLQAHMLC
jgi:hypothetical protein